MTSCNRDWYKTWDCILNASLKAYLFLMSGLERVIWDVSRGGRVFRRISKNSHFLALGRAFNEDFFFVVSILNVT